MFNPIGIWNFGMKSEKRVSRKAAKGAKVQRNSNVLLCVLCVLTR
jgi:hypothetical protein